MLRVITALLLAARLVEAGAPRDQSLPEVRRPPCAACLVLTIQPQQRALLPPRLDGLDVLVAGSATDPVTPDLLDDLAGRSGRPGLILTGSPETVSSDLLARVATVVLDLRSLDLPLDQLLYAVRSRVTAVRAIGTIGLQVGVALPEAQAAAVIDGSTAYWDFLLAGRDGFAAPVVWSDLGELGDVAQAIAATRTGSAVRWVVRVAGDRPDARKGIADVAVAARLLPPGLLPAQGGLQVTCDGRSGDLFVDPASLVRVAVLVRCDEQAGITVVPRADAETIRIGLGTALVRVAEMAGDRFVADVAVAATRRLTVEEIVARHQAAAARQASRLRTLISGGTLTVTFEAPGFPAPVVVSSATTIYRDAQRTDLEQRDLRVNGMAFRQRGTPRLPLVEAERVAAPPLAITLGDRYRYRLTGQETVGDVECYVVSFEPRFDREPLFRGRAWLTTHDFAILRIEAAQTGLRGAVVSSEQVDQFTSTPDGTWVLAHSDIRQVYQGAGYRTPIRRVMALAAHEVNAPDFEARRAAAYASEHVILRDSPAGYRYLEAEARRAPAPDPGGPGSPRAAQPGAAQRSTGGTSSRVRTLAFGVIVDPNISRPLPFAGLSYLDFDLFGTGAQINGFFGGTFGQLAFSVPSINGSRWQMAGQAFAIATAYNDRAFVGGREQYERNLEQRPASGAVWLLRALTPRLTLRAGYELDYTHLGRSATTAAEFTVPASQVAHGVRVALEGQRRGWDTTVWWNGARRAGWRAWGRAGAGDYEPVHHDFQRFGATVARSFVFSPRLVARGSLAASGGHDLDRFSRYSFGTFDNRLRGYPSALIRYDRGAAIRTALAWSATPFLRLDGFADSAFVRDVGQSRGVSRFSGLGAAVEAPAPFGTLVAAEWGYGLEGVNADGRRGTHVVRITGYKIF